MYDRNPESPREWDNLGTMICWHSRYVLGDKQPEESPEQWREEHPDTDYIVLPLYLYDHSGITMSVKPFTCPWDSGQVGYIYAPRKTDDMDEPTIRGVLESEVRVYDQYLRGDVYGYSIESATPCPTCGHNDWTIEDSCWGFLGDLDESGILDSVPEGLHDAAQEAFEKLDTWVEIETSEVHQ